jgi:hypothetical protein
MPKLRVSDLSTNEIAIFDTDSGELIVLPDSMRGQWEKLDATIDNARGLAAQGGMILTKKQLKTLLLATDRVVLLT